MIERYLYYFSQPFANLFEEDRFSKVNMFWAAILIVMKSTLIIPGLFRSEGTDELTVSVDAGWQRRGSGRSFDSLSGHCSMIGSQTGKIIDYEIRSKSCRICETAKRAGIDPKDHDCRKNWEGSSKAMERDMVVNMVTKMVDKGVNITKVVADEDTTTFSHLRTIHNNITKISDRNHIRKTFSSNLYGLQQKHKSLSTKVIRYLVKCFNYMLAQNRGNPDGIEKGLDALDKHPFGNHTSCSDSWCSHVNNPKQKYTALPYGKSLRDSNLQESLQNICNKFLKNSIKLSNLGSTQANESFNKTVSLKAPKNHHFSSFASLNYRVAASVAEKNVGQSYVVELSEYEFEVFPVEVCPLNKEDWDNASLGLNCNKTHGYHCVPNKNFTSLIEFCYPRGEKIPFHKGNCLELADVGILNHFSCIETFFFGCPDEFYFSNELYNYPMCLNINTTLRCFNADTKCIVSRLMESMTKIQNNFNLTIDKDDQKEHNYSKYSNCSGDTDNQKNTDCCAIGCTGVVLLSILVTLCLPALLFFLYKLKKRMEAHKPPPSSAIVTYTPATVDDTQVQTLSTEADSNIDGNIPLTRSRFNRITGFGLNSKSAIRMSVTEGRQQSSDRTAMKQLDRRGFNSLHLAAKEDNLDMFKATYESFDDITSTTTDGRNILHIAAFYGNYDICEYILNKKKELYDKTDNNQMCPAHWVALAGHVNILELMLNHGCDLAYKTRKYEENIVLFACMKTGLDVFKFVAKVENLASLLHAKNREGWNSIQYAAKNGNLEAIEFLYEKGVDIKNKSHKTLKNCLHTACEKGFIDICAYILQKCPDLIQEKDKNNKHVGHFVAKSGNTKILEELLKHRDKSFLKMTTSDNVTVLHIACKYARLDMCIEFEKLGILDDLVLELTEKGWNAALFLTEKAEDELRRIEILKLLDKHGLDVHHASRAGKTILYNACANQSTELITYLLQNYPDLLRLERSVDPQTATDSTKIKSLLEEYRRQIAR